MYKGADSGDKQQPDRRKRVEQEAGIGTERSRRAVPPDVVHVAGVGAQPGVNYFLERLARTVMRVFRVLPNRTAGKDKRQGHCANADRTDRRLLQLAAE